MRRAFKDAEFHHEYKKLTGEDPEPLIPEGMEKAIREMPRDAEVIELLKRVSDEGPLPARKLHRPAMEHGSASQENLGPIIHASLTLKHTFFRLVFGISA